MKVSQYSSEKVFALFLLVVVFVGIAAYSNSLKVPFQYDDYSSITDNHIITDPIDLRKIFVYLPHRFVTHLSFAITYHLWGNSVVPFHVTNLLIHCIVSVCVFYLALYVFSSDSDVP